MALALSDQALLRQLHGLALTIYQAQQDVLAAQARGDVAYVGARLQDLRRLRDLFADTARRFQANDPAVLGALDRFILGAGTWIEQSVDALPGAIAAIPNAILKALGDIANEAGKQATGAILPWLIGGSLVLVFLFYAEKSSTVRAGTRAALRA